MVRVKLGGVYTYFNGPPWPSRMKIFSFSKFVKPVEIEGNFILYNIGICMNRASKDGFLRTENWLLFWSGGPQEVFYNFIFVLFFSQFVSIILLYAVIN